VVGPEKIDGFFTGPRRGRLETTLGQCVFDHALHEMIIFRDEDHW
jgi:hypothetical protein